MDSDYQKIFSIPFNGDFKLMKETLASGKAYETYFSPFDKCDTNANSHAASEKHFLQNEKSIRLLSSISYLYKTGLNLLCNSPSMYYSDFAKIEKIIRLIPNITTITIADPIATDFFVKKYPNLDIQASFIMNLDTYSKIRQFAALGGGTVVLPGTVQRNLNLLEKLKKLKNKFPKLKIKAIANLECASECLFLPSHYMGGMFRNFPFKCGNIYSDIICYKHFSPADFIRVPFIRPEDIVFYTKRGLIDYFKIIFRSTPTQKLKNTYSAYFSGKYSKNLFDLVYPKKDECTSTEEKYCDKLSFYCDNSKFPSDFIEKVTSCDKNCDECDYCGEIAKRTNTRLS